MGDPNSQPYVGLSNTVGSASIDIVIVAIIWVQGVCLTITGARYALEFVIDETSGHACCLSYADLTNTVG